MNHTVLHARPMSDCILPFGLALVLVGALTAGCKGATADLSVLDGGGGSSGGEAAPSSLTQGASGSGGESTPPSGGDDGPAGTDVGDGAHDGRAAQAAQVDAASDGGHPVDEAGPTSAQAEGGDDASSSDDAPSFSDDAPAPTGTDAGAATDGLVCRNLGCFDFLDCAIFHSAEIGPCGFTKCVNLVCQ